MQAIEPKEPNTPVAAPLFDQSQNQTNKLQLAKLPRNLLQQKRPTAPHLQHLVHKIACTVRFNVSQGLLQSHPLGLSIQASFSESNHTRV
jgi:hypothetical protein